MPVLGPNIALGAHARRQGGGGWSPAQLDAYMATLDRAVMYDFAKTDRHWQEATAQTLADDAGENIGFAADSGAWAGRTYEQQKAQATPLRSTGVIASVGSPPAAATYNTGTGAGTMSRSASTDQSYVTFDVTSGAFYAVNITNTGAVTILLRQGGPVGVTLISVPVGQSFSGILNPTNPTIFVTSGGGAAAFTMTELRRIAGDAGLQSTVNFQPKRQANGAKYDGSDDRSVTTYGLSGSGDLFALDYADIPASLAATQILFGAQDGSGNGTYLGVTTGGALRAKIGQTVIDSTGTDLRGGRHRVGVFTAGSTAYLFADNAIVGSGAWTGSLPTTTWTLGAVNANGTPSAFFGGSLFCPVHGRDTINLARARQIAAAIVAKGI